MKSRYSGSAFGPVWAYVQPLVTILVFWFVFQLGFKNPPVENVEYILWFIAADIPWVYFNDGLMSSSNVFYEYSYLVKKMKFQVWLLPIVKVLSSLCIHSFFLVFIIGMYFLYGYSFQLAWISILYYSFCITVLLVGLAYLVSAISVFLKDNTQIINIVLQLGFWMTPIFWSETSMNESILAILQKNPLYYVVTGYRDALINGIGFWRRPVSDTLYFWCVTLVILALGVYVYTKLRDHFADLL
jgi:ABC-type polysaccharide/polyol phosphate export permease